MNLLNNIISWFKSFFKPRETPVKKEVDPLSKITYCLDCDTPLSNLMGSHSPICVCTGCNQIWYREKIQRTLSLRKKVAEMKQEEDKRLGKNPSKRNHHASGGRL